MDYKIKATATSHSHHPVQLIGVYRCRWSFIPTRLSSLYLKQMTDIKSTRDFPYKPSPSYHPLPSHRMIWLKLFFGIINSCCTVRRHPHSLSHPVQTLLLLHEGINTELLRDHGDGHGDTYRESQNYEICSGLRRSRRLWTVAARHRMNKLWLISSGG